MIILFFILLYPSFLVGYILFHYIKDYISFKISTKKFHKKYDIKKSDQKRIVFFQEIGLKEFFNCFSNHRDHKYHYLGISWNIFHENTDLYDYLEDFIKFVDKKAKPWWVPRFVLNLLHLFANDNSIVRCRDIHLSYVKQRLTGGIIINDIKTKYGTLRVYGNFTKEIDEELTKLENLVDPHLEIY
jgi:hypothetical protein